MAGKYKVAQNEKWKKLVVGFSFYILKVWQILKCLSGTFHQSKPLRKPLISEKFPVQVPVKSYTICVTQIVLLLKFTTMYSAYCNCIHFKTRQTENLSFEE